MGRTMTTFPVMTIDEANALLTAPGAPFEMEEASINGVVTSVYKTAPRTVRDLFLAGRAWQDRTFLVFEDERVSYEAHFKASCTLAHALVESFDVKPGDRVAIAMRNYPQWSVAFHAALIIGAVVTPMNAWWSEEELTAGLTDSGAKVVIVDPERHLMLTAVRQNCTQLQHVIVARSEDGTANDPRMESIIGPANAWKDLADSAMPDVALSPDAPAAIMYTSGTSAGASKGVVATHRNAISAIWNTAACKARSYLRKGQRPPEPSPEDPPQISLMSTPLFHATACFTGLVPAHLTGARLIFQRKFDAGEALRIIQREGVTQLGGVPAIVWQLIEHPDRPAYDLSGVQLVGYGGAPSSPELVKRIADVFPNAAPGNGWGMTETCATCTLNLGEDYVLRPGSAGAPAPSVQLRIVDGDGQVLPPEQVGELEASGPNVARDYWKDETATSETFHDGWVRTGDLAYIDEDGFLFLVDRKKDIIIRGGENIYSAELEDALYAHPDVMDASVVGLPHTTLGEVVGAVVQLRPGAQAGVAMDDDLRRHVGSKLAAFKVPAKIKFLTEPLPRNANGKILKSQLREMFEETPSDGQETGSADSAGTTRRFG